VFLPSVERSVFVDVEWMIVMRIEGLIAVWIVVRRIRPIAVMMAEIFGVMAMMIAERMAWVRAGVNSVP